jgi:hypothetical protein
MIGMLRKMKERRERRREEKRNRRKTMVTRITSMVRTGWERLEADAEDYNRREAYLTNKYRKNLR